VSLHEFITDPETGMQAYTQRLQHAVAAHGTALSAQQLVEVAATVGLPQHIITGLHQVGSFSMQLGPFRAIF